ncbi:MAG TPA: hypothetical protein PLY73_01780, partial [Candidatus Ozemobacteraceae bacterium]|nr:hypothetical protein [Candidatus Ozemobacteraceae bacterium]
MKSKLTGGAVLIALLGFLSAAVTAHAATSPVAPSIRSVAQTQAVAAKKGGEACLSMLLNRDLSVQIQGMRANGFEGVKGNISRIVGGRNFTAADLDYAEVPFY